MKYISPYQLLNISTDHIPDRESILNSRKEMLARLELSGKSTIKIQQKEYTKDGIMRLFDEMLATTGWNFHKLIADDEGLLQFLETGDGQHCWYYCKEYEDPAFVSFISPWFVQAYSEYVIKCVKNSRPFELKDFFNRFGLLDNAGVAAVSFKIQECLDEMSLALEQLTEDKIALKAIRKSELRYYYSSGRIECLNLLADEFTESRSRYAMAVLALYVEMFNKLRYHQECSNLITNIVAINCDVPTRGHINHYLNFNEEQRGGNGSNTLSIIWMIIRLVAAAAVIVRCANHF
jgi:hypothetical protein